MSELPPLTPFAAVDGSWTKLIDGLYVIYTEKIAFGGLKFRGLPVSCQYVPVTGGKAFAFWHMMQESVISKDEDDRTIDPDRCRRILWIPWVIKHADQDERIRVFLQVPRGTEISWALWLYEQDYVVILHERKNYFVLKTAFLVRPHKRKELERDWNAHKKSSGNG